MLFFLDASILRNFFRYCVFQLRFLTSFSICIFIVYIVMYLFDYRTVLNVYSFCYFQYLIFENWKKNVGKIPVCFSGQQINETKFGVSKNERNPRFFLFLSSKALHWSCDIANGNICILARVKLRLIKSFWYTILILFYSDWNQDIWCRDFI